MAIFQPTDRVDTTDLLQTKLAPPRLRQPLVPRPALLDRLSAGLDRKLTLISAPAGFGKTTLVAAWLHRQGPGMATPDPQSPSPVRAAAWVALDEGDNDPVRFWRYVGAACRAFGAGVSALELLQASPPPFEAVLTALINDLAMLRSAEQGSGQGEPTGAYLDALPAASRGGQVPYVLVLEDYHVITAPMIQEQMTFLLGHLPASVHLIIITRHDPPLPLARLRAHAELNELRAADLRFSLAETRAFLRQAIPFPLPPDLVTRLAGRAEGWIAGLRLLALALQGLQEQSALERYLTSFTGSHRPILEYLVTDVFEAQPEPIQRFLLQTSILSRLTASLCDAVIGEGGQVSEGRNTGLVPAAQPLPPAPSSQRILDQLVRANLFLVPLDGTGQWYRYHGLFAEAMQHEARRRLGEARVRELAGRASCWYEQHGLLADAVEAALTARDHERAADLIERLIDLDTFKYEVHTLRNWVQHLPETVLQTRPALAFAYAGAILFTSDRRAPATLARLQTPLQIAEQHWQATEHQHRLGEVLAFRALIAWLQADLRQAFAWAHQAQMLLPVHEVRWRGISLILTGVEQLLAGELHAARQTLSQARALCEAARNSYGTLDSTILQADACARQGDLHQAAQLYRQALAQAGQAPMDREQALIRSGRAQIGLGALALEWNDLETAEQLATQAVAIGEQHGYEDLQVRGALILASILHARGSTGQARHQLRTTVALARQPLLIREAEAAQARLALAAHDIAAVERWHTARAQQHESIPRVQSEQEELIAARLLIAQGQTSAALHLLEGLRAEAQAAGRTRSVLEMMVVAALAHAADHELESAGQILAEALGQAQPEGYVRLFLDEGEPMRRLIGQVLAHGRTRLVHTPLPAYAGQVLAAFSEAQNGEQSAQEAASARRSPLDRSNGWVEPLSPQEQRVLQLLAAGHSNLEMAQALIVSINTIKTHIKSIYRKLNVTNRIEACNVARHLSLI